MSKWKDNLGKEATYRALIEVFFKAGKVNYADAVCDLFKDPSKYTCSYSVTYMYIHSEIFTCCVR